MSSKVVLKVNKGSLEGQEFTYDGRASFVLGRTKESPIRFKENTVSRYHCYIDINPPAVMVRDFGSTNGTYLNGKKIGQKDPSLSPEEAQKLAYDEFQMKSGDILGLGISCEIVLNIMDASVCADCSCEIEEPHYKNDTGQPLCKKCHEEQERKKRKRQIEELRLAEGTRKAAEEARKAKEAEAEVKDAEAEAKEEAHKAAEEARRAKEKAEAERKEKEEKAEKERKAKAEAERKAAAAKNKCAVCGDPLDEGANGTNICSNCRKDPLKLLMHLLGGGKKKENNTGAVAGYRNIKQLGQGGMGQVWLVEEEKTGERMALKLMIPEMARDELCKKMFLREAKTGCALEHESVVRHYKCGHSGDLFFILMEFCKGGSVDKLMEAGSGSLGRNEEDIARATSITLQLLDGLYYTHNATVPTQLKDGRTVSKKGVVHRDLKPGNIFVANEDTSRPIVKVADFGLAKAFDAAGLTNITQPRDIRGTIVFMPRQQILDSLNAKSEVDAWAAAASYYNMLTGLYPKDFKGKNNTELLREALTKKAVPIRRRNSSIPEKLAGVIDAALIDDPEIGIHKMIEKMYGREPEGEHVDALVLKKMIWEALPSNYQKRVWDLLPPSTKRNIEK
jgi:serine/threonine-protein kinase